jgi:hypothetical protein
MGIQCLVWSEAETMTIAQMVDWVAIALLALAVVVAVGYYSLARRLPFTSLGLPLLAVLAVLLVCHLFSVDRRYSSWRILVWCGYLAVFYLALAVPRRWIERSAAVLGWTVALVCVVEFALTRGRARLLGNPNITAAWLLSLIFLTPSSWPWLVAGAAGIVATGSRGAFLALAGAYGTRIGRWALVCLLPLLALVAARPSTVNERLHTWKEAVGLFLERPLVGWGPGCYPVVARYEPLKDHADNFLLTVAAETGVVGLAAWGWLLVAVARRVAQVVEQAPARATGRGGESESLLPQPGALPPRADRRGDRRGQNDLYARLDLRADPQERPWRSAAGARGFEGRHRVHPLQKSAPPDDERVHRGGPGGGGFVKRADNVVPLLGFMQQEMDKRLARFEKAGGIQNLSVWNYRRHKNKLPRLALFVDELAVIMLDPSLKRDAKRLLADITARGRAPGVHVVLATQRPEVAVVPGLIKGNLDARFAFRVTDNPSSMVILDSTEAARFDDSTPPGRYIFRSGLEKVELQAPLITDGQIAQYVKSVCEGRNIEEAEDARVPPEEIFRFSVRQLEGNFSYRALYQALEGEVSADYLRRLGDDYEGEFIDVDGDLYELRAGNGGNQPRRLVFAGSVEGRKE